jgi:hypothetical protein
MNQKFFAKAIQRALWMGALLLSVGAASASTLVTFQVDMSAQVSAGTFIPGTDTVSANALFTAWGPFPLTNNSSAANPYLYTGTTNDTSDANGTVVLYKYVIDGSKWESTTDGQNRCAQLPAGGGSLLLPVSFYGDAGPTITADVTFQVDMSEQIYLGVFNTNTGSTVEVNGFFSSWDAAATLTNPTGALTNDPTILTTNATGIVSSNVYVGTIAITGPTNGTEEFKFVMEPGSDWESPSSTDSDSESSNNRFFIIATQTLPIVSFSDVPLAESVSNNVTFEVDMTEQILAGNFPSGDTVEIHGDFNGWGAGQTMTNNPSSSTSNIYSTELTFVGAPGTQHYFKYVIQPGTVWENVSAANSIGGNRWFDLAKTNGNFVVGPVYFSDEAPAVTVTNNVTFEVDMTTQIEVGNFPSGDTVEIHGDFNGWGAGQTMTNNPSSSTSNIYSTLLTFVGGTGEQHYFKYVIQPGTQWENVSAANSIGGNRWFDLAATNGNFVVGPAYFSDEPPSEGLADFVTVTNCLVTFTVDMTPAITNGTFTIGVDTVYINGLNNGVDNSWWTWPSLAGPPQYALTEIGSGTLYTVTVPVNQGQPLDVTYKYGIDGQDDEAPSGDNHTRYIRSLPNYTMPTDVFGGQGKTTSTETSFGDFTVGRSGNHIDLSWLGRRGVSLQSTPSLTPPVVWQPMPLTDGTNLLVAPGGMASTNYTIGSGALFFRLIGPPQ